MKPFFNGAILLLAGLTAVNADPVRAVSERCKYGCMAHTSSLPAVALDAADRRGEDFVADTRLQSAARRLCGVPAGRYLLPFVAHVHDNDACEEGGGVIFQHVLALHVTSARSYREHCDPRRIARSDESICYVSFDALLRLDHGNLISRMFRYIHEYSRTVVLPCAEPLAVSADGGSPIPFRFAPGTVLSPASRAPEGGSRPIPPHDATSTSSASD